MLDNALVNIYNAAKGGKNMLCQFKFKNFKSYRDETILDLQATTVKEHSDSLLTSGKEKRAFLPVSVIYGPNAGGKSGIIEALYAFVAKVIDPLHNTVKKDLQILNLMRNKDYQPFAFNNESPEQPMEFTAFFRQDEFEFCYDISFSNNGNIERESLYRKTITGKVAAMIFERDSAGVKFGASVSRRYNTIDVKSNMPYISYLYQTYDIEIINKAIAWFTKCIFANQIDPLDSRSTGTVNLLSFFKNDVLRMLHEVDIPISDFYIKYFEESRFGKRTIDTILLSRNIAGTEYKLDISEESRGTYKLLGFIPLVLIALSEGRLLAIDELDANIHPKLLRYIIKLFTDKSTNKNGAQLVFTSHDVTTMKSDIFRRDEIWFAAKNDECVSDIYSLYEIRNEDGSHIKSTASFDKQYMEGRYGADPYFSEMQKLSWDA